MNHTFHRDMLDILSFGIGYLKPVFNRQKKTCDYVFLEMNTAFETLTGLRRGDILERFLSCVWQESAFHEFDWISYFDCIICAGKTQETTQWIEPLGKSLHITIIPSDRNMLALVVREVAEGASAWWESRQDALFPQACWSVFDHIHDSVSLVEYRDKQFRYVHSNKVHQRVSGFSDIVDLTPVEIFGEEVGETLLRHYEACIRTGRSVTYEQSFRFASGEQIWQTEATPIFDGDRIQYLLCSAKDVAEREEAQGENEGLSRRLQSMFNLHSAVMLVIDPITGRIVDANPAACEFYGYSKEEIKSLTIQEINVLSPEQTDEYYGRLFADKPSAPVFLHRLKNGRTCLVDVYSCPIRDGSTTLLYSIIFDVTDRERYRRELMQEKELLKTTLRCIGDGVVTTDNEGIITSINNVAEKMTGWDSASAVGKPFAEIFILQNEETGQIVESPVQRVMKSGRIVGLASHTVLIGRQGQTVPIVDSAAPIRMDNGMLFGVVMVFRDVSLEKEHISQLRFASHHDTLTGLPNRQYIEENLSRIDNRDNLPLSVIVGDINGLKITNDVLGHQAGDELLQNVADLLESNCRKGDLVARWGGDEFVVFMPRTSLQEAEGVLEKIKKDAPVIDEQGLRLSLSFGCVTKERPEEGIRTAIREAEENMHHQKLLEGKSYRNTIINTLLATLYEKSMETEEHSKRMEQNCHAIGRRMHLSSKELDELSLLTILHDIGKVGINSDILKKPARLTDVEWEEMKRHPEIGYRIVQATPELAGVADLILCHHERWDGNGYPRGLFEDEIPVLSRILAVTDAYDAMTNDRVYREAMSAEQAIHELKRNAGIQFDPQVVNAFIEVLQCQMEFARKGCCERLETEQLKALEEKAIG